MTAKKSIPPALTAVAVLALVGLLLLAVAIFMTRSRPPGGSTPSQQTFQLPSGVVVATTVPRPDGSFVLELRNEKDDLLIQSSGSTNPIMRWFVCESKGNIWFYSGDIGLFAYVRMQDGLWKEVPWRSGTREASMYPVPDVVYDQLPSSVQGTIGSSYRDKQP